MKLLKLLLRILGELLIIAVYLLGIAIAVLLFIVLVAGCAPAPEGPIECPPERCIVQ